MVVRNRLTPQPAIFPVTGTGGLPVTLPTLANGENICAYANLQPPGAQQGFTVIITNIGVYIDYTVPSTVATVKAFTQIYTFPVAYPRYARFGTCVIGTTLYFSSASHLGVYALSPTFSVMGVTVTNPGGYFNTGAPTVVFSDGGGSGATGTSTVVSQNLTSVTVTASGSGYIVPPIVNLLGGSNIGPQAGQSTASAVAILSSAPAAYAVREITAFTGVAYVQVTAPGTGYLNPTVAFIGGGGTGAQGEVILNSSGQVVAIAVTAPGQNYTSTPTVEIIDSAGTGATATAKLYTGTPFIGGDFMATMAERLILGNVIGGDGNNTVPLSGLILTNGGSGYTAPASVDFIGGGGTGAVASTTESGGAIVTISFGPPAFPSPYGSGYSSAPQVDLVANTATSGTGATAIAQLGFIPQAASTTTAYPDRVAWSAPNAYSFWDPNYAFAPGGFNTLTEARGLVCSVNVVESVAFVGHNGGITEMTPNTSSAEIPYAFYPLWSSDQGIIVRYGSMAQYGTTLMFLSEDSAYTMTPGGLNEVGQNIANLLRDSGTWDNGLFPLQGLYGSIVEIEGEKHYLIAESSDDWSLTIGASSRVTQIFDFNMSANNWHTWNWLGITFTCPVYQSFDLTQYTSASPAGVQMARDSWLLCGITSPGITPDTESASVYELTPLVRNIQLLDLGILNFMPPAFGYQFRTEAPSIARMQSERRALIEYENQPILQQLGITPVLVMGFNGQQDPTTQTGTVAQTEGISFTLNYLSSVQTVAGQILTAQTDYGTFTAVCTTLGNSIQVGEGILFALVRLTQIADIAKGMIPWALFLISRTYHQRTTIPPRFAGA
jgi:hypothetical protein